MGAAMLRQEVDAEEVRRQWAARGFSCGMWSDPPGTAWENYIHTLDEVLMVMDGVVEVELDGRKWQPPAGEEVFIPRGTMHSVRNTGKTHSHWLYGYSG